MAQWLRQALAQEFGVAAQLAFPLPSTFIWQMFSLVLPQVPELNPYTKGAMAWRLMTLLPHQLDDPSFAPLAHYLAEDPDQRKGYQLSQRIADVFDQYLVYRPDWIADWEQGGELGAEAQPWQPRLWRALVTATEQQADHLHRANLFEAFIRRLEQPEPPAGLPQRLFIFGINALPPNYLQALRALGRHMEVHLMQGNPCRFYWGDLLERWRTDGRLFKQLLERRRAHILANLEQEAGHRPLFASQGSSRPCSIPPTSWRRATHCWSPGASRGGIIRPCWRISIPRSARPSPISSPTACCSGCRRICWICWIAAGPRPSPFSCCRRMTPCRCGVATAPCGRWRCCTMPCWPCWRPMNHCSRGISW